ncbi:MAG: hypothetical protein JW909_14070 [Planctomycetes bacterium]|nr:hypothetical protein [Planctomycetota bacterium]
MVEAPEPIDSYPSPAYPLRSAVSEDPSLLSSVPSTWTHVREIMGLVSLSAVLASGCSDKPAAGPSTPAVAPATPDGGSAADSAASADASMVAPIFAHGEGRGAIGCIVMSPPVFLSEDEAMQFVIEELAIAGIDITRKNVAWPEIRIKRRLLEWNVVDGDLHDRIVEVDVDPVPLSMDGVDEQRKVAFEFVSERDYRDLGGPSCMSSVQDYDMRGTASNLARCLREGGTGGHRVGVFYDPVVSAVMSGADRLPDEPWKTYHQRMTAPARAEAKDLLRRQVADFVDWLRQQGAL